MKRRNKKEKKKGETEGKPEKRKKGLLIRFVLSVKSKLIKGFTALTIVSSLNPLRIFFLPFLGGFFSLCKPKKNPLTFHYYHFIYKLNTAVYVVKLKKNTVNCLHNTLKMFFSSFSLLCIKGWCIMAVMEARAKKLEADWEWEVPLESAYSNTSGSL